MRGKFLYVGDEKLYVRGVTYGAFRANDNGNEYYDLDVIERDFAQMAENRINAVRIPHTMPPRSLLDAAQRHGLRVMVGLSAEQYAGYLSDKKGAPNVEEAIREKVRACVGHPALLCYALGNEIPAATVRWLGRRRVERYLERLYHAVKDEDPEGLVTYVNYPSTEYLQLPFLDLVSFNVYLEEEERLEAYLARLQNIADERPLIMSELGLDSLRNGEEMQASALDWQIRTTFRAGCAGAFVFSWTDEWYRGGACVDDWAFGITDAERRAKPGLAAVRKAFDDVPLRLDEPPRVSVIVCTYNGNRTIGECLEGLLRLDYPNYEVIVVDDGSTDDTSSRAREYGFRLISTHNLGLANARNVGLGAAAGEIVAYIDDDARPDPHWLTYLADAFARSDHVGIGGPNIPPPEDGPIAGCVARAPGGPTHVLLTDAEAEHIPGCNMAFRKSALQAIGGFDPQFRIAGDDVDVCWRLQARGWTLGFSPGAVVYHHPRNSVRGYWKQQKNYGKAEALLERKWPEKYNGAGHVSWSGRIYGTGFVHALGRRMGRVYHGVWGTAPFQSLYQPAPTLVRSLPLMPDWYFVVAALATLTALGASWAPLLAAAPLLTLALGASLVKAGLRAARTPLAAGSRGGRVKLKSLIALLHLMQPLARLLGRLRKGLSPWRRRGGPHAAGPRPRNFAVWSESWRDQPEWLHGLEAALRGAGARVRRGGDFERWDLEVCGGILGGARLRMAVEDHGSGAQYVRVRVWPRWARVGAGLAALAAALAVGAAADGAAVAAVALAVAALLVTVAAVAESAAAMGDAVAAVRSELAPPTLVGALEQTVRDAKRDTEPRAPHPVGITDASDGSL